MKKIFNFKFLFWFLVFLFVSYCCFMSFWLGTDLIYYIVNGRLIVFDSVILSYITFDYGLVASASLLIWYLLSDLLLYIYSYHIYWGKKNWYKFYREREKQQRKENSQAYKDYCSSLKNKVD